MAKRKKKLSKLNHAIRRFFDNDPFDDGITRVDGSTLSTLVHTLGILPDGWNHEDLVRTVRRLWSEGGVDTREQMVRFFREDGRIYPSPAKKEPVTERTDKIDSILEEMDIDREEAHLLRKAFADVRTKKINRHKMEQKLAHIRFTKKKAALERVLQGHFDLEDRFEFNAAIKYDLFGQTFTKIQLLKTPALSYNYLLEQESEAIIAEIERLKRRAVENRQLDVNKFLKTLDPKHPYLSKEEIVSALRSAAPEDDADAPSLDDSLLKKVLGAKHVISSLHQGEHDVAINIFERYEAGPAGTSLNYEIQILLEKRALLKAIWKGEPLGLEKLIRDETAQLRRQFEESLDELAEECFKQAKLLQMDRDEVYRQISEYLFAQLHNSLTISPKLARKTLSHFTLHIQEALHKRQKQELLARTIRDFKNLFPLARELRRKLVLHIGPTNSGKTYRAMQSLKKADTGYYLAPLRLLALEGYEDLRDSGIDTSLITGEEQLLNDEATHISSTIEMLNFDVDVDVCVIDEVQMIDDRERGWAWANAIIGAPAKTVIMTGSPNSRKAIESLAEYLGEPLEVIEFERMNPLELMHSFTPLSEIAPSTAVVAFSRKDVLRLKQQLGRHFSVSVVYGNLSPEVRREEARRFRDGETEVLIATDAIAMGLNLPIKTILFFKAEKFDGENRRPLTPLEIQQISGRAGRYGLSEKGYVGALKPDVLKAIQKSFYKEPRPVSIPFNVMANLDHIKLVGSILEETSITEILRFFAKNMSFDGPFRAANLDSMLEAAEIVDRYDLDLSTKYHLACAPLTLKSPYIVASFERYVHALQQHKPVAYIPPEHLGDHALSTDELLKAEDRVKEITLYLWLSYRFGEYFVDAEKARRFRGELNRFIENSLKKSHFIPRCRLCAKALPANSKHTICQSCFHKMNCQKRRDDKNRDKKRPERKGKNG
ncbi:MAG: helicase [Helicobacteraceae bacterium 4484_230]|nr:MAG: helicase [Helicobacteraceae bacterium 4484_230]